MEKGRLQILTGISGSSSGDGEQAVLKTEVIKSSFFWPLTLSHIALT